MDYLGRLVIRLSRKADSTTNFSGRTNMPDSLRSSFIGDWFNKRRIHVYLFNMLVWQAN